MTYLLTGGTCSSNYVDLKKVREEITKKEKQMEMDKKEKEILEKWEKSGFLTEITEEKRLKEAMLREHLATNAIEQAIGRKLSDDTETIFIGKGKDFPKGNE